MKQIKDGARHEEVREAIEQKRIGDLPLSNIHDWESLKAVMRCFGPQEERDLDAWEFLIENIHDATQRTAARNNFVVKLESDVGPLKVVTGTPPSPH